MKGARVAMAILVTAVSCRDAPSPVPAAVVAAGTAPASQVVASVIDPAPTFEVQTASGTAIGKVAVSVAVTAGSGTLVGAPTRSLAGPTPIGQWTLGTVSGPQSVVVTVAGVPPLVITVEATAGPVAAVVIESGNNQRAPENTALPEPVRVRARDAFGNGVAAVSIAWAVTAGGGSLDGPATTLTDASGVATAPSWILGLDGSGTQRLTATLGAFSAEAVAEVQNPPASITIETDAPTSAVVGSTLGTAPSFAVRDANGMVLNGVPVTVAVTAGGGSLAGAPTVSASGPTEIGAWTLGTAVGTQSVTVTVEGVPSAVFTTEAVAGPSAIIQTLAGADQSAPPGALLANPIQVRVADAYLNPIASATVSWSVVAGGGVIGGTSTVTDGNGETTAPSWALGNCGGPQTLRAVSGAAQGQIGATMTQTAYALELRWVSPEPGGTVQTAFDDACKRIRATVVDALSAVQFTNFDASGCQSGVILNETIPGLRIYATVEYIDGPGGVLGSAGPCYLRDSNKLTVVGKMRFDSADLDGLVANGTITSVILHEMLHVIGVGTLWNITGLQSGSAPTTTPIFLGALAKAACIDDHGGAAVCGDGVPIEDCEDLSQTCGSGTINSHWKESVFANELMTGFLNSGANPFSKMTIQSLADMGYGVDFSLADAYTVPAPSLMAMTTAFFVPMPAPFRPLAKVDANGRVVERYE